MIIVAGSPDEGRMHDGSHNAHCRSREVPLTSLRGVSTSDISQVMASTSSIISVGVLAKFNELNPMHVYMYIILTTFINVTCSCRFRTMQAQHITHTYMKYTLVVTHYYSGYLILARKDFTGRGV